jgi:hypothetical protein
VTKLDRIDEQAASLSRDYAKHGSAAFQIRTTESGDIRVIGMSLPAESVAKMLHAAADAYLAQAPSLTRH